MSKFKTPTTRNVTRVFRTATVEQIAAGADWYRDAHEIATALAVKNGITVEVAAGVIAALSPLQSWGANINLAARFLAAGGLDAGYLSLGLAKGRAILKGAPIEHTLRGDKIRNFFRSIITEGAEGVCIDRHSYSVAVNERSFDTTMPKLKGASYERVAECYRRAAKILSNEYETVLTPAQIQAVTWVQWRRRYWAEGAFDGHTV